jgi:DNA polymerase-3 subunit alpha
MNSFTHLHCHSNYSFLEGASRVEELVQRAGELGMDTLALTDTNGLYGAIPFYKAARSAGIKPILGVELRSDSGNAVFLARNNAGYEKLCQLVSSYHLSGEHAPHKTSRRKGPPARRGFDSLLRDTLARGDPELYALLSAPLALKLTHRSRLSCNMYLEIPSTGGPAVVRQLTRLAARLRLPPVATGPVYFALPEVYEIHRLLTAIRTNTTVETIHGRTLAPRGAYLKPGREVCRLFAPYPEAVENANLIAAGCNLEIRFGRFHLPRINLPHGETAAARLQRFCLSGLRIRYGPPRQTALERLRKEIGVIEQLHLSPYFLAVHDIVREARRRGVPMIGRGSAAGSIVAYCLGITHVDPLRHNLYFERFLNPERRCLPDIDLDLSWKRRDEIINYVYKKYGQDNVAMISTLSTFGARSAVREIGKALGVPERTINIWTAHLPYSDVASVQMATELVPECRGLPTNREPLKTIVRLARAIDGYPRHLGVHASGIVVSPLPLTRLVPLQIAPKGIVVTQYEMHAVEEIGLVKIDLLGQRSLAVLEDALQLIEANYGIRPAINDFSVLFHDRATIELIRAGRTMGCFYIESPAMRQLLQKLDVRTYEDLIAASSVIRPGVAGSGMMQQYINRHRGREKTSFLHPKMEELLSETHGVMIYQEDVMRVAHLIAGMTLGEADLLRRAMSGKMRSREAMAAVKQRFIVSAASRGIPEATTAEIWRQIESFAAYSFCKAHSASFALLSFQVAFLKAHWPAEFMAAVISNGGGFYHTQAYLDEARRLGVRVLPPDINLSDTDYRAGPDWIRVGLIQIKGLKRVTLKRIVDSRGRDGFFVSLTEFCRRVTPNKREAENLIKCGAFDAFELTRPELLCTLHLLTGTGATEKRALPLFPLAPPHAIVPRIPDYDEATKVSLERALLGVYASCHPLAAWMNRIGVNGYTRACDLALHPGTRVELIGWLVCMKRIQTAKGEYMRFITMEDMTDLFEIVLFPRCYNRYGHLLKTPGPFAVRGRAVDDSGSMVVIADRIRLLGPRTPAVALRRPTYTIWQRPA